MKSGESQSGTQDQTNKSSESRKRRLPKEAVSVPSKVTRRFVLASHLNSNNRVYIESLVNSVIDESSNSQLKDNLEILTLLMACLIQHVDHGDVASKKSFFEAYEQKGFRESFNSNFLKKKGVGEAFEKSGISCDSSSKKTIVATFVREIKPVLLPSSADVSAAEPGEARAANQPAQKTSTPSHSLASQPSQRTSGGLKTTMAEGRVDRSQSGRLSMLLPRAQAPACISQIPAWSSSGVPGFAPWIHPGFPTLPVGQRGISIPMFWGSGLPYQVGVPCFLPAPQGSGLPYQVGVPSFMPVPQMSFVQGRGATRMPQGSALPYQAGMPRLMPVPQMGLAQGGVPTRMPQASVSPVSSVRANNAEHTARKSSKQSAVSSHSIFSASGASANKKEISSTKHHSPNASP